MKNENISRQHEATTLVEVAGKICREFVAVYDDESETYQWFYIEIEDVIHRFFLDAGLLFWRSHQSLDPENDLYEGSRYVDLGEKFQVIGVKVVSVSMGDCCLDIKFGNGVEISLKNEMADAGADLSISGDH